MVVASLVVALISVLALVGVSLMLRGWGLRVAARRGGSWRRFAQLPLLALAFAAASAGTAVVLLVRVFGGLADAAPDEKSRLLADGIAHAMNCAALLALPAIVLYALSVVIFFAGDRPSLNRQP